LADTSPATTVLREFCPACHSPTFDIMVREPFASPLLTSYFASQYQGRAELVSLQGLSYELARCCDCRLAFQRMVPGGKLLNEIYERWILPSERERLHAQYTLHDYRYLAEQVQFLVQHFGRSPHSIRTFDFGMGWGEWAAMAKAFGCQVAGAELSEARVQHARSMGIEVIDWDDIPKHEFHFVNTEQVFEHLLEPLETLKHLASSLVTGGILKISVPDSRATLKILDKRPSLGALSAEQLMTVAPLEHINSFESSTLAALANVAHLRPIRPSLRLVYNSCSGWLDPKHALRLLARPIYRHWFPKSTFAYYVKD
jgi:2-polyprenyl-3-methyl-5-hydroxy-6-metoxy-1,4-benzoquinol methylase